MKRKEKKVEGYIETVEIVTPDQRDPTAFSLRCLIG